MVGTFGGGVPSPCGPLILQKGGCSRLVLKPGPTQWFQHPWARATLGADTLQVSGAVWILLSIANKFHGHIQRQKVHPEISAVTGTNYRLTSGHAYEGGKTCGQCHHLFHKVLSVKAIKLTEVKMAK